MTTVGQATWHNMPSRSPAPAGLAVAYPNESNRHYPSVCVTVRYCSGAGWPGCAVTPEPSRLYVENMRRLAHDRAVSAVYDSRIEKVCHDHGFDSAPRRAALEQGRSVVFLKIVNGRRVVVHCIKPEEIL